MRELGDQMQKAVWWLAPALGLGAMVVPVLVWPPVDPYPAPLFPLLRNAQEYLGLGQLALFFLVGIALGRFNSRHPWCLGITAVSTLPVAAVTEVWVDPTSHTLLPLELIFYAVYGLIVTAGILTSRRSREGRRLK